MLSADIRIPLDVFEAQVGELSQIVDLLIRQLVDWLNRGAVGEFSANQTVVPAKAGIR